MKLKERELGGGGGNRMNREKGAVESWVCILLVSLRTRGRRARQ